MTTTDRRSVLLAGLGLAGTGLLAACSGSPSATTPALVSPSGSQVTQAEAKRRATGREKTVTLTATAAPLDLGGATVRTWRYEDLPQGGLRLSAGDTLVATLKNHLPAATSIHWHGLALRNDMDGVPPVTMRAVQPGADFTYRFVTERPGTHWFHPHTGVQLDRALYGPLIVDDPKEPLSYDAEWVVVLDDWLDGVTGTPDQALSGLRKGMAGMDATGMDMNGMDGMDMDGMDMGSGSSASPDSGGMSPFMLMGATSRLLGGDAGDVAYPYHLVNGRLATAPDVYQAKPGTRVRLRIINAGGDTAYRLALGGHRMTITHTDGYPVQHEEVDALLLGMGERYDVLVTLKDGVFPLTALAEGKSANGMALVRTGSGTAPAPTTRPAELDGRILRSTDLRADESVRLPARKVDRTHRIELTGGMAKYDWALNGKPFDLNNPTANPFTVTVGERVRLRFVNRTTMWHPMHLHGHAFQAGAQGPRKDTVIVLPGATVECDFDADNPGQWLTHCHNLYHGEAGMMGLVAYAA
ncbi:multicopper oxidase family protein [Kitasatospora viridis]|uniref:FtsP/CotA-like multicopper oxidase with cupredoxin domain n=1 Tax=Kitasatospora viridis TaxID=281105 RepID=A0A561SAD5_9ACTN|nr:multicopper oxidase family protein [Kitasatospora viridis]TWF71807.1 FtsP/CotA-like multicopper oxidase with cupredoxin domain [Kitasatospora viridis]